LPTFTAANFEIHTRDGAAAPEPSSFLTLTGVGLLGACDATPDRFRAP